MLIQLSYGLGQDKNGDGDGLAHIGQLLAAKYKSAHIEITTVPHDLKVPVGLVSKPFIIIGQSAGAGAAEKWALNAGVPIQLMILAVTYPLLTDGQIIAQSYNQPAFVEELIAYRLKEGFLPGVPVAKGHNFHEVMLLPIPGQTGTQPHMGVYKRPDVIEDVLGSVDRVARARGVS